MKHRVPWNVLLILGPILGMKVSADMGEGADLLILSNT